MSHFCLVMKRRLPGMVYHSNATLLPNAYTNGYFNSHNVILCMKGCRCIPLKSWHAFLVYCPPQQSKTQENLNTAPLA